MNTSTSNAMTETVARSMTICPVPGCGRTKTASAPTDGGYRAQIVCSHHWSGGPIPFKYYDGTFKQWYKEISL